jgi:hypothetical protein
MVLRGPALADARDHDRGLTQHGAFGLADAATNAELQVHMGLLQRDFPAVPIRHRNVLEADGLLWRGADLFADDAGPAMRSGQATPLVDHGQADLRPGLFCQGKLFDGAGRTNLAAERATVLAVTQARYEHRRPDPLRAGLQERKPERPD